MTRQEKVKRRHHLREAIKHKKAAVRLMLKEVRKLEVRLAKLGQMRKGGGRSKGNGFENKVAKIVVATFGMKGTDCYRTPSSGGHRFAKKKDPGDLVLSKRMRRVFPFSTECKSYKEINLLPFWRPEKKHGAWEVRKWIAQAVAACNGKKDMYPLVVFKENQGEEMAILPEVMPYAAQFKRYLKFQYNGQTWFVVRFKDLLKRCTDACQ
jgi:hypothetical protein